MTETDVAHIGAQALTIAAEVSAPLLLSSLVIGIVISLLQVIFQVQDQMLSMVPRLAVGAAVLAVTGGWMLRVMVDWTQQLFASIPGLVS